MQLNQNELASKARQARVNIGVQEPPRPSPAFASWRPNDAEAARLLQFLANAPTQMPVAEPAPVQPGIISQWLDMPLSTWTQRPADTVTYRELFLGRPPAPVSREQFPAPPAPLPPQEQALAADPGVRMFRYLRDQYGPVLNQYLQRFNQGAQQPVRLAP